MRTTAIKKKIVLILGLLGFGSFLYAQNPEMVFVEGGSFTMGTNTGDPEEGPAHQVTVSSFYICKHEVTVAEYKKFLAATGKKMPKSPDKEWMSTHTHTQMFYVSSGKNWWGWQASFPIHNVTWNDAVEYCNWLSSKSGLQKCYVRKGNSWGLDRSKNGYRLPTEAEWEFAAAGGTKGSGTKYSGSNTPAEVAWYDDTSKLTGPRKVKSKKPNALGLYDMSGNVWEWCSDYFHKSYYAKSPAKDPYCEQDSPYRALRGGGWHYSADLSQVISRDGPKPDVTNYNYGFRIAKNK